MSEIQATVTELLQQFASVMNIDVVEAERLVGAPTAEEVLENIQEYHKTRITEQMPKLNRKQRRALLKKSGKKGRQQMDAVTETAKKLNYIDLIQKLQELNKKREEEDNAGTSEED